MAEITLNRVDKVYPASRGGAGFHAVKALDLAINDGEFLVLLGPSGCGKSTTLRMIAGLEEVSDGTISIGGRIVNDVHPKDRDIAMVFQNYALYPHMTVRDNMAFALKMRKIPKPEIVNRVGAVAEMLGLTDMLDRKPAALSGGQRQRVAVGRAIVREPKAFLFDEPLSNLDAKLRGSTRGEIKSLHQRLKTTTVYVTHDQEEAMTLGDRIAIMAGGIIRQHGAPMDLYRAPVDRFVAGFLGTPPMNFLEGRLKIDAGRPIFLEGSNDPDGRPHTISLPHMWADKLATHAGKDLILGIRPQGMELLATAAAHPAPGDRPTMKLPVSLVEPLGDQMDLTCSTPKHPRIIARVQAGDVRAGQTVTLAIDPGRVHVFEPGEFGRNLSG
jgi:multiple sugar transport system ATP-binding protein